LCIAGSAVIDGAASAVIVGAASAVIDGAVWYYPASPACKRA
jgi:hypothetical protein